MGDWANGLLGAELRSGKVLTQPFPASDGIFVFTSDTFPLPVGVEQRDEVLAFLGTIAGSVAQREFSSVKGSIPARNDVRMGPELESASAARRADFFASEQVLATSGYFPPFYPQGALEQKLEDMVRPGAGEAEVNAVIAEIADAQPLFASWQARLNGGAPSRASP
jgi:ABC-type glycerol-3-phosphate transport system substrate-binding protein